MSRAVVLVLSYKCGKSSFTFHFQPLCCPKDSILNVGGPGSESESQDRSHSGFRILLSIDKSWRPAPGGGHWAWIFLSFIDSCHKCPLSGSTSSIFETCSIRELSHSVSSAENLECLFFVQRPIFLPFSLNCVAWWEGNACLLLGKCRGQRLLSGSRGVSTCPHLTNQCSPLCLWGMSDTEEGWVAVGVPVEMLLGVWRPGAHSALHISSFQASSWFSELLGPYNKQASGFSRYTESLTTTPAR